MEYTIRILGEPVGEQWRISLKQYGLVSLERKYVTAYLLVLDVFNVQNSEQIERHAFVYALSSQLDGAYEILCYSKNSFKAIDYNCGVYNICRDLKEKIPGEWERETYMWGNMHGYLEKAPWNKMVNISATLARALMKMATSRNKKEASREELQEEMIPYMGSSADLVLTIHRNKKTYTSILKEKWYGDDSVSAALFKAIYHTNGYDEAIIEKAKICGRLNSSPFPVVYCP